MTECGICLDVLRNPVSVPCGHVHCEKCLYTHVSSGADALKATCPTCRKTFHIATPDFKFVPEKYHNYILPCVRKIYMDIPSVAARDEEIARLTQRLQSFTEENALLRQRCKDQKLRLKEIESERDTILSDKEKAQHAVDVLYDTYVSLKEKYRREILSHDDACSSAANLSRRSGHISNTSREILPKEEEFPVTLSQANPPRPKRALPKSRLSKSMCHKDGNMSQTVKRQRTQRHSDIGSSSRSLEDIFKNEDEDEEYE